MLDFDKIHDWEPEFTHLLARHVPSSVISRLVGASPECCEDARNLLLSLTDRCAIVAAILDFFRSEKIAGYHGSRLTEEDLASVHTFGLLPLDAEKRRSRLVRALSVHPRWDMARKRLDDVIRTHGPGSCCGNREGQVHLTLSRLGLTDHFNHYLTHGSEFDQHAAHSLLGEEGTALLACDGKPTVIRAGIPGILALEAAHPYFTVDDLLARGDLPNIVNEFLSAWSFRLAHKEATESELWVDCGMVFHSTVPPAWIIEAAASA